MLHFYLRVVSADMVKVIISVSKKISKKSVVRNRIRRRIRPIVQKFAHDLKPATYFIIAQPGAERIKGERLRSELAELLKKR